DRQQDRYKTYSLGMKQRLSVAAALLSDPEVLVLDEPTNGLDPQGITDVRELIQKIANQGKTIILASHLLDEVQKVCSHFAVLRKGKLIHQGEVADINADPGTVEVRADDMPALQLALNACPLVDRSSANGSLLEVKLQETANAAALNAYLFEKGVVLTHLNIKTRSLEKAFLEILQERA
ncbi:MAG: AAA family ATPase, partial [Bacteroidota bacterium]